MEAALLTHGNNQTASKRAGGVEMKAITLRGVARASGAIPTPAGDIDCTTNPGNPAWVVDSIDKANPFYEGSYLNIRNASSTTIFDAPGGASAAKLANAVLNGVPGTTIAIYTAHFDTYLIQNNRAAYHVSYSASTSYIPGIGGPGFGPIGYSVGAGGAVTALPANLRTVLLAAYPTFTQIT